MSKDRGGGGSEPVGQADWLGCRARLGRLVEAEGRCAGGYTFVASHGFEAWNSQIRKMMRQAVG
jgi:hypothetical protein